MKSGYKYELISSRIRRTYKTSNGQMNAASRERAAGRVAYMLNYIMWDSDCPPTCYQVTKFDENGTYQHSSEDEALAFAASLTA